MGEVLHDINEHLKGRNINGVASIWRWFGRLLSNDGFLVAGCVKSETAHSRIERVNEAEVVLPRSRFPLDEIITLLLSPARCY